MKLFFSLIKELPISGDDGSAYIEYSALPNGVPVLLINPDNMDMLMATAKHYAITHRASVELIAIDIQEILATSFTSPSAVPNLPGWVSLN